MARNRIGDCGAIIYLCLLVLSSTTSASTESTSTYRGKIVTEDGSPLPADLELLRRVSGEQTQATPVDANGEFVFQTDPDRTSARFSMTGTGFAPFDSKWLKLNQPIELSLARGAMVQLHLKAPDGSLARNGSVSLNVPWWDEDDQGMFAVDEQGVVTIPHCPLTTVNFDLMIPGFEELRIRRLIRGDVSFDVPLRPSQPTTLRLVSGTDGTPVAGAKIRFHSRVRAESFLIPFQTYGDGRVWGESDINGRVKLTTLRAIDPVPTNVPSAASYCFLIDAPGYAPFYLSDIRAGNDLGDVKLDPALEVRGEIVRDAQNPEEIRFQYRQSTIAHGGTDGESWWETADLVEIDGKLTFHLTGLRAGPLEIQVAYVETDQPGNNRRQSREQVEFYGLLFGSSSDLQITREKVIPGDDQLTQTRPILNPNLSAFRQSNVPDHVLLSLTGDNPATLFSWSSTAPIRHTGGHVNWRIFVLNDGTVFIPGGMNRDAGTHHKLSESELRELNELLEKHSELFGKQIPNELPKFASWEHGHQTLSYTKDGITRSFTRWYGFEEIPRVGLTTSSERHQEIEELVIRLMTTAKVGGQEALTHYRQLANQALTAAIPQAIPFNDESWLNATNRTDGTREITFSTRNDHNTNVVLIDPAFGEPYVERIEYRGQRVRDE